MSGIEKDRFSTRPWKIFQADTAPMLSIQYPNSHITPQTLSCGFIRIYFGTATPSQLAVILLHRLLEEDFLFLNRVPNMPVTLTVMHLCVWDINAAHPVRLRQIKGLFASEAAVAWHPCCLGYYNEGIILSFSHRQGIYFTLFL